MKPKYNLKFDRPDTRDFYYSLKAEKPLPLSVDLRRLCSAVENQEQMGSCTANALVGNLEFLENRMEAQFTDLSRLFIYYNERSVENTTSQDSGATLRDGIKVLKNYGVCPEKVWPYDEAKLLIKPSEKAYALALKNRISKYERLTDLAEFRDCLARDFCFVFGIEVYESFESDQVRKTGVVPMPTAYERQLGGHALLAVGYDDQRQQLLFRNSWGASWGDGGYGWIPYEYLRSFGADFWVIRK